MSKGWKRKLKEMDKRLDIVNHRIYNEGLIQFHLRDNFLRKRIDFVDGIGRMKRS